MSTNTLSDGTKWLRMLLGVVLLVLAAVAPSSSRVAAMSQVTDEGGVTASADPLSNKVFLPLVSRGYDSMPPLPSIFGIQMYGTLDESHNAVSLARAAHAYWVRWPLTWAVIEPTDVSPDQYNWTSTDAAVQRTRLLGQKMIMTIASAPSWAAQYSQGPITAMDDFVEFIGELVERYDGDGVRDAPGSPVVDRFEFFNEPDSMNVDGAEDGTHSLYGPYGADYAAMLCAVYPVVKQHNPQARVVFGGIASDYFTTDPNPGSFNPDFLNDVLGAGGGACFDVMNFHYYPGFAPRWNQYGMGVTGKAWFIRNQLATYGYGNKPMIITEAGWRSDAPGSPAIQSAFVMELFTQSAASHLETMTWWSWIDIGLWWGDMGLVTTALTPKPSYGVYKVAAEKIGQAQYVRVMRADSTIENYLFTNSSGYPMYVVWTNDNAMHSVTFSGHQGSVIDMYGNTIANLTDGGDGHSDGRLTFAVGQYPVYVEVYW